MATSTITYHNTIVENAIVFTRSNGEQLNMSVQHYGTHHEVVLAIYAADEPVDPDGDIHEVPEDVEDDLEPLELLRLSYAEARLLRDLLNREEVKVWLEQDF